MRLKIGVGDIMCKIYHYQRGYERGYDIYYLVLENYTEGSIFTKLGIPNRYEFMTEVLGYDINPIDNGGDFPEIHRLCDIYKIVEVFREIEKVGNYIEYNRKQRLDSIKTIL